jgi:hypothetical protein
VWPSGEDWPQFYAWRGALGERRSLEKAPGHRFDPGETLLLAALLKVIMENAWDADVLCSVRGRADKLRARISHDEWFELLWFDYEPPRLKAPKVSKSLTKPHEQ